MLIIIARYMKQKIIDKLQPLKPIVLEVTNFSEQHRGHAGSNDSGESHFDVLIVSSIFDGQAKINRHKMIYKMLSEELNSGILHALKIKTYTPVECQDLESVKPKK